MSRIANLIGNPKRRKILLGSIGFLFVRMSSVLVAIIATPLALSQLGLERYGLWMALTGVVAMMAFVDLGLGSGLMNITAEETGKDSDRVRVAMSNSFYSLCVIVVVLFVVLTLGASHVDWSRALGIKTAIAQREALPAVVALVGTMLLNIPAGLVSRVQLGNQEGALNAAMAAFNWGLCLVGTIATLKMGLGLPWVIVGYSGAITLGNWVNFVWEFWFRNPHYRPRTSDFNIKASIELVRIGLGYLLLQMLTNITLWSDYIIVSNMLGATANGAYSVAFRFFSVAQVSSYMYRSLWPAFTEMLSKADYFGAEKLFVKTGRMMLFVGIAGAAVLPLIAPPIVAVWTHHKVVIPTEVCWAFGLWFIVMSQTEYVSSLCMANQFRKEHTVWFSVASVMTLPLRIALVATTGMQGVVYGVVISHFFFYLVPMVFIIRRKFDGLKASVAPQGAVGA